MTTTPFRLLLLEDNEGDARLVQTALAEHAPGEFAITRAERLADALSRIGSEHFDAVLCDLGLPDSTGLATAQAIAARAPALPLVVLTGSHNEDLGREAIHHGAQDYVIKGEANGPMVARTLRYAIERKRLEIGIRVANESLARRVAERTAELDAAMKQLSASETRFRELTELTSDWYWEQDENFRFTWFSEGAMQHIGIDIAEYVGCTRRELPIDQVSEAQWAEHRRQTEARLPFRDFQYRWTNRSGGQYHLSISGRPVFDEGGRFSGYHGVGSDITMRKRAEEALREGEERYRQMFQANPHPMWVYDLETLRFLEVNDAAMLHYGWPREEFLAMTIADIRPPEDVPRLLENVAHVEKGKVDEAGVWTHRKKDGALIAVEITSHVLDVGGRRGEIVLAHDITKRKQAERELVESEARFRGLVEQSIAGTYIIQDGKFAYVNPRLAEIFGYGSADEIIGRDLLSVVAEKDRDRVVKNIRRRIEGEVASVSYDFTGVRKDGSMFDVGVHGARATHLGRPAIIGLIQDISEKKRAEEEIRRYLAQLETALMSTVQVVTTLSEMRDPYRAGHERRVAQIAVALGAELGFDDRRTDGLRVAGYLHDVGTIGIPAEILSKPGRLSPIEYKLIQGHSQASYDVLKDVEFPWPVAQIALQHHERMDGSGYPQGLKGEAILIEARIMAVADVVEAMSSHRPYRPGLGIEKALAEIERGRGTAYDTEVTDACLRLFREKGYTIPA